MPTAQGAIRLFRFAEIQVFLHWSWFLVLTYEMNARSGTYSSFVWNGIEYVTLFAIVTLHEFGHALACRRIGGRAERIILWPLGGVAYVDPPPRPGATLWSIVAGPLVNVALLPVLGGLLLLGSGMGLAASSPNLYALLEAVNMMNLGVLLFNVLPIYPLDGGQILRSLLWFFIGPARSLTAASAIGLAGVGGLGLLAYAGGSVWIAILGVFIGVHCMQGLLDAHLLKAPRREGYACPSCRKLAPKGRFWSCAACRNLYDPFESSRSASQGLGQSSLLGLSLSSELGSSLSSEDPPPSTAIDSPKCSKCRTLAAELKCPLCGAVDDFDGWKLAAPPVHEPEPPAPVLRPSFALVILGIVAVVLALPVLLAAMILFKASSDELARLPVYEAQIWAQPGIAIPGEGVVNLQEGVYDAYLETGGSSAENVGLEEIAVVNPGTGGFLKATLREASESEIFRRNGREIRPTASFTVPSAGRYAIHAITTKESVADARIKIGPRAGLVNGSTAESVRVFAIGVTLIGLLLALGALLMFYYYYRRRRAFKAAVRGGFQSWLADFTLW